MPSVLRHLVRWLAHHAAWHGPPADDRYTKHAELTIFEGDE